MQDKGRVLFGMLIIASAFILLNLFARMAFGYFQIQEYTMVWWMASLIVYIVSVSFIRVFIVQIGTLFKINPKHHNVIMWALVLIVLGVWLIPQFLKTSKFLQKFDVKKEASEEPRSNSDIS